MQVNLLSRRDSLVQQFVSELRDAQVQQDRMRFRKNVERIGQVMAYEVSKTLGWKEQAVQTPLGTHHSRVLAEQPVLASILRAGLGMHQGVLDFFDKADSAFVAAYRRHNDDHSFDIAVEYMACPELEGRTLLLIDPMLATGRSLELVYQALMRRGTPKEVHILTLIASEAGMNYLQSRLPGTTLWIADLDKELDENSYIVPGLGDAGDLSYGIKR